MDWLEQELKQALGREEPSPDFADRVIRKARSPIHGVGPWRNWLAAAAAVLVFAGAGLGYRHHQGMIAKERVMLAVRLTAVKVNHIQTHLKEFSR
jgi:hypothetical protein